MGRYGIINSAWMQILPRGRKEIEQTEKTGGHMCVLHRGIRYTGSPACTLRAASVFCHRCNRRGRRPHLGNTEIQSRGRSGDCHRHDRGGTSGGIRDSRRDRRHAGYCYRQGSLRRPENTENPHPAGLPANIRQQCILPMQRARIRYDSCVDDINRSRRIFQLRSARRDRISRSDHYHRNRSLLRLPCTERTDDSGIRRIH